MHGFDTQSYVNGRKSHATDAQIGSQFKIFHPFFNAKSTGAHLILCDRSRLKYFLSNEKLPPPNCNKSNSNIVIAKSVLYSCANGQKPLSVSTGIFVLIKATIITTRRGTTTILVRKPNSKQMPHAISNVPVKFAQNAAFSKPIFSNLPLPETPGKINFCNPSDKNTRPVTSLGTSIGADEVHRILFFILQLETLVAEWRRCRLYDHVELMFCDSVTIIAG
jgi:hypothetical protein